LCELIVIDRAGGTFSLSTPSFVPITCLLIFLVAAFVSLSDALQRESAKILLMASCGMRVAMEIGVSCDHVSRFYRYLWHAGSDVWKRMYVQRHGGTISPLRHSERVPGALLDDFVSEFGFGRRQQPRDSGATNLLGSLIKARCRLVSWE